MAGTYFGVKRPSSQPGSDFPIFGLGRRTLYIRRDLTRFVPEILNRLIEAGREGIRGTGNRMSGFLLDAEGAPPIFARRSRRGGLVRLVMNDIYFGLRPRPVRELTVSAEAARRGIPVAEPLGAMVEWVMRGVYRSVFLTAAMSGMTLWELLRTDDDPDVRSHILAETRGVIDTMHRLGLCHADLNLNNIYVTRTQDSFNVVLLDLDKARLFSNAVSLKLRRKNLKRLYRSARKLDPFCRYLPPHSLDVLTRT